MPLAFSVIVPFFNAAPHIRACVEGLLAQDFPSSDYEIVMVDNDSTAYHGLLFCSEVATILRGEWMTRNFRI